MLAFRHISKALVQEIERVDTGADMPPLDCSLNILQLRSSLGRKICHVSTDDARWLEET